MENLMKHRAEVAGWESSSAKLLELLQGMSKEDVRSVVSDSIESVTDLLWTGVTALQTALAPSGPPPPPQDMPLGSAKYLSPFTYPPAEFATTGLQGFSCPLDTILGPPSSSNPLTAMKAEHCAMPYSSLPFTPSLNAKPTTPAEEWEWVGGSVPPLNNPDGRRFVGLDQLMELEVVKKGGLSKAEVAAIRLYTGPMGDIYNKKLQGGVIVEPAAVEEGEEPRDKDEGPEVDAYVTTLHALVSAVVKLTRSSATNSMCVYRPLTATQLPEALMAEDGSLRVGVESGCLSTTLHKALAAEASAALSLSPAILEIHLGQVHGGALIQELSLFPDEGEVVVTPLSRVELDGEPRV